MDKLDLLENNSEEENIQLAENIDVFENDDGEENEADFKRKLLLKTRIVKQTWSISEIYQKINGNDLILDPDYQRALVWDDLKQTAFIESLFMGIVIPPIYVIEIKSKSPLETNKYEVVDGKQRLSTILRFLNNHLLLKKKALEYYDDCFGNKKFSEISNDDKYNELVSEMLSSVLDVYVITANSPDTIKYDIFSRLNKGSQQLRINEIRKAIYRSDTLLKMEEYLKPRRSDKADPKYSEYQTLFTSNLILRYEDYGIFYKSIAFYKRLNVNDQCIDDYRSRPRDMINTILGDLQSGKIEIENEKLIQIIDETINLMIEFKDLDNFKFYIDVCIYFAVENNEIFYNKINEIKNDHIIKETFEKSKATTSRVNSRVKRVCEILQLDKSNE